MTLEQAQEYLASIGATVPDFLLAALVEQVNNIEECLEENGASEAVILLIQSYLLGLLALFSADRYVTSERAPSGAARSYKFSALIDRYNSLLRLLKGLDIWGCTDDLIPESPAKISHGFIQTNTGGCL